MPLYQGISAQTSGRGTNDYSPFRIVETPSGALYAFYLKVSGASAALCYYAKSTNHGRTWSEVVIDSSSSTHNILGVWYDRWSGINGDIIHIAFSDVTNDDVFYRSLDTATDTLGTKRTALVGVSTVSGAGNGCSICVARGGNIYIAYDIDSGTEIGFLRSTDGGVNWSARTSPMEAAGDAIILMPGFAADNQDIMAFFWDTSAAEISRKIYDDSANTWAETSISLTMTKTAVGNNNNQWAATVDLANSQNILIAWNGYDTANADLQAWKVTEGAITAVTNVVTDHAGNNGLAAITMYGSTLYAYWGGLVDGSESISTASIGVTILGKTSTDTGTTWSSSFTELGPIGVNAIYAPAISYTPPQILVQGAISTGITVSNMTVCTTNAIGIS